MILSIFLPGFGQVYNGDPTIKGLARYFLIIVGYCIFLIPGLAYHIYLILNAYDTRKRMNAGEIPYEIYEKKEVFGSCVIALIFILGLYWFINSILAGAIIITPAILIIISLLILFFYPEDKTIFEVFR